uniref:Uncharacterized protein n=1 Tax=Anguilla anguilla TaxID=7936 RepID=A0A0E9T7A1_ANGAN
MALKWQKELMLLFFTGKMIPFVPIFNTAHILLR